MQIQKPEEEEEEKGEASSPLLSKTQVRLKTLSLLSSKESKQEDHQCYGSSSVGSTDLLSRASSSDFCDYIGTESCMDVFDDIYNYNDRKVDVHDKDDKEDRTVVMNNNNNNHNNTIDHHHEAYYKRKEQRLARIYKKKEYPPPIPLLVRTENLPSHMPWILKRQYTSDRRLILTEEKVRHHEYLRAHRSNGRLTLYLVPMDDDVFPPQDQDQDQDQELEEENEVVNETSCDENDDGDDNGNKEDDEKGKEICDHEVDEEYSNSNNNNNNNNNGGIMQGGNSEEKWFDCSSVRTRSACIFSVTVPAIRPVHS